MLQRFNSRLLVLLMLASAALVGCGAGDPEAPPPPVSTTPSTGSGPDTTPPTVTIASDVSAPVATGPVTFTFVFSEDVGVSFDAGDITVTGGTASGFNRISGRQATLVVTPPANATGSITVNVAAGSFTDIAGNANTAAASAAKDFAPAPPPPPPAVTGLLLADFDTVSPPIAGFEGGEGSAVEAGPAGGSGNALKVLRSGGQSFALAIVTLPNNVPLEATRKTISARVYSPTAGIPMVLKLEGPGANPTSGDVQANEPVVVGWQTLTWTINAVNTNYNVIVLLPNLGTVDAPPGKAYYFDDIQLLPASSSGTVLADFDTVSPPIAGFEGGEGSAVEAGPAGGSGNALKVLRSGGRPFALAIVTLPSNIPLAAGRLTISARVNSPTAGIPVVLKLEGPGGNPTTGDLQANETVVVGWQTLTWTVPAVNTNYNVIVLLPNLGTVDAPPGKAYYFDDITLLGASSGGGGGGGTFTGGIFASDYSGDLGNQTAKSDKNGTVGFFFDPRLFDTKVFDAGGVSGSTVNPGGVPNFFYGVGKPATPVITDGFFGAFVNAPGNGSADASPFAKIRLKFWGDAESWEQSNFTAQVDVIVQGPTNAACTNPSGRPEIKRTVPAQKIGAGSEYIIAKTEFTMSFNCGGAYTVDSVWSAVGSVVVLLAGTNLQYVNSVGTPIAYPTFLNMGPISFIN